MKLSDAQVSLDMHSQKKCLDCNGTGLVKLQSDPASPVDQEYCPCRQPTAVLTVRGTGETREGLADLTRNKWWCRECDRWMNDSPCNHLDIALHGTEITRRCLRWTGEEPLDLMALAEADPECPKCSNRHQGPRPGYVYAGEEGEISEPCPCLSLPGVDGVVIVDTFARLQGVHWLQRYERNRRLDDVNVAAERMGLEVEYAD